MKLSQKLLVAVAAVALCSTSFAAIRTVGTTQEPAAADQLTVADATTVQQEVTTVADATQTVSTVNVAAADEAMTAEKPAKKAHKKHHGKKTHHKHGKKAANKEQTKTETTASKTETTTTSETAANTETPAASQPMEATPATGEKH